MDAFDRTDLGASAAIGALGGIDDVLAVVFADGLHGALGLTGSAGHAFVGNLVRHK